MCCDVLRDGKKSTLNEIERREGIQRCTTVVGRATHHTMLRTVGEEGLRLLAEAEEGHNRKAVGLMEGGAFRLFVLLLLLALEGRALLLLVLLLVEDGEAFHLLVMPLLLAAEVGSRSLWSLA